MNLDPKLLTRDPFSGQHYAPAPQPGYYPGYNTLSQQSFWDAATRKVILSRIEPPGPLRFFTPEQAHFWEAVFDRMLPQSDRSPDRRIPLIPPLDQRLAENRTVGYRFADMPHDRDVYAVVGIEAISREAREHYSSGFLSLGPLEQDLVLRSIHDGRPRAAADIWQKMSVHRFWQLILHDAIDAYYAHPWAWDEIGFGGPAYPRAYTRLERGEAEPWEVEEERYEWLAPIASASDEVDDASHHHTEAEQHRHQPKTRPA
jgi:hypothetical protein